MPKITMITETRWTQPDGRMGFQYEVRYESGRKRLYNWQDTLPMTVVQYLTDEHGSVTTKHVPQFDGRTLKIVKYTD